MTRPIRHQLTVDGTVLKGVCAQPPASEKKVVQRSVYQACTCLDLLYCSCPYVFMEGHASDKICEHCSKLCTQPEHPEQFSVVPAEPEQPAA